MLILAEAFLVYGAMIAAVYLRVGWEDAPYELVDRNGYMKAAVAGFFHYMKVGPIETHVDEPPVQPTPDADQREDTRV